MGKLKKCFGLLVLTIVIAMIVGCSSQGKAKSNDIFSIVSQADAAYTEGRWMEAEYLYQQVTVLVPHDHHAWFRMANAQLRQGRLESAIYNFNEAVKRNEQHAKTYFNLSVAYILKSINQLELASQSLRENDPGKVIVAKRIEELKSILGEAVNQQASH